uniref:Uncharacterized protein n=1 Tax=Arundo donax TaxID=35708 RepID=A0A0A8Y9D2_ARUDO
MVFYLLRNIYKPFMFN